MDEEISGKKRDGRPIGCPAHGLENARKKHLDAATGKVLDGAFLFAWLAADDEPVWLTRGRLGLRHSRGKEQVQCHGAPLRARNSSSFSASATPSFPSALKHLSARDQFVTSGIHLNAVPHWGLRSVAPLQYRAAGSRTALKSHARNASAGRLLEPEAGSADPTLPATLHCRWVTFRAPLRVIANVQRCRKRGVPALVMITCEPRQAWRSAHARKGPAEE